MRFDHLQADLLKLGSARRKTVVFVPHDIVEAITLADRVLVFSTRPSRIKLDEAIAIPRPREVHEVRFHPAFEDSTFSEMPLAMPDTIPVA